MDPIKGTMKPAGSKRKRDVSDTKPVRRSGRIPKIKMGKGFHNTIGQSIQLSDSDNDNEMQKATATPDANSDDDFQTPLPVPFAKVLTKHHTGADITHRDTADDDDFVTQPPTTDQSAANSHEVGDSVDHQQPCDAKRKKSTATRRKSTRPPASFQSKKYEPFSGPKIKLKTSPDNLVTLVNSLNKVQKNKVIEMGFGALLNFNIHHVPTRLAFWLASNYDDAAGVLNFGATRLRITSTLVNTIFGIPNGGIKIVEKERARDSNPVVKEWRDQFNDNTKVSPVGLKDMMITDTSSGRSFELNWLVLYNTILGEISACNTVNQRFLGCVDPNEKISNFDWSSYMITCLDRTTNAWNRKRNDAFRGPIVLLAAAYAYDQRDALKRTKKGCHPIELIDDGMLDELLGKLDDVLWDSHIKHNTPMIPKVHEDAENQMSEKVKKISDDKKSASTSAKVVETAAEKRADDNKDEGNEEYGPYEEGDDDHMGIYKHCKSYLLSQPSTQEPPFVCQVGADGEFRIPMVSQYGTPPVYSQEEKDTEEAYLYLYKSDNILHNTL
ncbi:uncharacterized protein LOC118480282 [Helianthus annuus]|uniref:uncharacterized protein LOC118480282 n=1 Tax=Helianthus annuus TaxID=4232 RepID=UPI00165321C4|nr:uncharacterized protein LOC118480282 [Helianthus annuus]